MYKTQFLNLFLAYYFIAYFADNRKCKWAIRSVDIPTEALIINYICVDITSSTQFEKLTQNINSNDDFNFLQKWSWKENGI